MEIDTRHFDRVLVRFTELRSKSSAEVLNLKAKDVIRAAMKDTPKADPAEIRRALQEGKIMYKLAANKIKERQQNYVGKNGKPVAYSQALLKQEAKKILQRRLRSVAYTKAGWLPALKDFGGTSKTVRSSKAYAAKGKGTKATEQSEVAEFINTAPMAEKIGKDALQEAINSVAEDMCRRIMEKVGEDWSKAGSSS